MDGSAALVLALLLGLVLSAGALVFWPLVGLPTLPEYVLPLVLAGMVVGSGQAVVLALLAGQERHARYAWMNAAGVVLSAAAGLGVLVATGNIAAYLAATVLVSGGMLVASWCQSGFQFHRTAIRLGRCAELLRDALPFLGWNVVLQVRLQVDVIVVAALLNDQAAGWLAAAYRIIGIPVFIPAMVTTPLLPALSRVGNDRAAFEQTVRRSVVVVLLLIVPAAALISVLASEVPEIFRWGPQFSPAVPLIMILAFQQPLVALDMVLGTALVARNQERAWLCVMVVAAIFNPAMNFLMIPAAQSWWHNGAVGAVLVELATEIIMLAGALILLPRGTFDLRTVGMIARIVIAGAALMVIAMVFESAPWPVVAVAGGVAYCGTALALGVLRMADLWSIYHLTWQSLRRRTSH
jgi:O-antigen/teichoic acid export membrane protein